ncbi:MAG: phosphotransferase family protein [Ilumatobacteraceae bacterium]
MSSVDLAEALRRRLGCAAVTDVVRLSGGASRETFRFVADGRPCVLQRQRAGDERDMAVEAAVLRAAHAAGVPVAAVIDADNRPTDLGTAFIVTEAIEGETIARRILRDDGFADARTRLVGELGRALALLHATDVDAVAGLAAVDQLVQFRQLFDSLSVPHPAFELAFRWLDQHRPAATGTTLVHGDFRLGNVIVGPDGLRAVLDWELAHVGDPMEDLGWLCVRAWRFGGRGEVAGLGSVDDLAAAYRAAGGRSVDPDAVHWWQVLGTLKWGIMCIVQAQVHLSGAARSHELAAIGRRVCENEHDLFLALEGRW